MSGAVLITATSGGMTLSLSPTSVVGFGSGTVTTTAPMGGSVSGGTAPYTWSWSLTGDPGIFAVLPANPSTLFRRTGVTGGNVYAATATLTVTDSVGQTASASGSVSITGV